MQQDRRVFAVHALWDGEAGVWVADSDDVPGLTTEAETLEDLLAKLRTMVPELLELNGVLTGAALGEISIRVRAERTLTPSIAA